MLCCIQCALEVCIHFNTRILHQSEPQEHSKHVQTHTNHTVHIQNMKKKKHTHKNAGVRGCFERIAKIKPLTSIVLCKIFGSENGWQRMESLTATARDELALFSAAVGAEDATRA